MNPNSYPNLIRPNAAPVSPSTLTTPSQPNTLSLWKVIGLICAFVVWAVLVSIFALWLLSISANKTPLDTVAAFANIIVGSLFVPFFAIIENNRKKAEKVKEKKDDEEKQRQKDEKVEEDRRKLEEQQKLERERQDRIESSKVLDSYTEAMARLNLAGLSGEDREKAIREITLRTHHAFMRVVKKDKLRIVIMLMRDELITNKNSTIPLDGADLSGIDFTAYEKEFLDLNFSGANLEGAVMKGKDFTRCNFSLAILTNATFDGGDFSGGNFSEARYSLLELQKAILTGAIKYVYKNYVYKFK